MLMIICICLRVGSCVCLWLNFFHISRPCEKPVHNNSQTLLFSDIFQISIFFRFFRFFRYFSDINCCVVVVIVVFFRYQLFQYMADEGAETPTVLPKCDFYFVLQTAASDISNQHQKYPSNNFDKSNKDRIRDFWRGCVNLHTPGSHQSSLNKSSD